MSDNNTVLETDDDSSDEFSTNVGSKKTLAINSSENSSSEESENDENAEICAICLGKLKNAKELGNPENCDHHFCFECILEWSKNVTTCPVDRVKFKWVLLREELNGQEIKRVEVKTQKTESSFEDHTLCEICHLGDREERLLLCDGCDKGFHLECLTPALFEVPRGEWFCPTCAEDVLEVEEGVSRRHRSRVIAMTMANRRVLGRLRRESRGSSRRRVKRKSSKHNKSKKKKLKLKTTKRKLLEYMGMKPVVRKGKVSVKKMKKKPTDDDNQPSVFSDSNIDPYSIANELYDDMHQPSTSHTTPPPSSSSSADLLSSILKSQAILFMDAENVKIDEDGSLQPLKPIPDITMHTSLPSSRVQSNNPLNDTHLFNFMLNQNHRLKTSASLHTAVGSTAVSKASEAVSLASSTSLMHVNNTSSSCNINNNITNGEKYRIEERCRSNEKYKIDEKYRNNDKCLNNEKYRNNEKYKNSKNCYKNSKNSPPLNSHHLDQTKRKRGEDENKESRHKKAKLKENGDEGMKIKKNRTISTNDTYLQNNNLKRSEQKSSISYLQNNISLKRYESKSSVEDGVRDQWSGGNDLDSHPSMGFRVIEVKPRNYSDDDEDDDEKVKHDDDVKNDDNDVKNDDDVDNLLSDAYNELENENYFNDVTSNNTSTTNNINNTKKEKGTEDKKDFLKIKNDNVTNNLNSKSIEASKKHAKREKLKATDMLVSKALRPFYTGKQIDKQQYKHIMRKTVPKIAASKEALDERKVVEFVRKYVKTYLTSILF